MAVLVQCYKCEHADAQTHKKMANAGFANCEIERSGFYPFGREHECDKYKVAKNVQKRIEWFNNREKS